jgi:ribonuclease T2
MKMRRLLAALGCVAVMLGAPGANADVPASGTFTANEACPAVISIKKGTNPGNATLAPNQGYRIVAANKTPPTHYLVIVPGAQGSERRWVAIDCGSINGAAAAAPTTPQPAASGGDRTAAPPAKGNAPTHFVLAVSWEPGFCAGHGDKAECGAETEASFEASHFTLHGLWPDPKEYCGVAAAAVAADKADRWSDLPPVDLSPATRGQLTLAMPGVQSLLERHEWLKHGTCAGAPPDAYFGRALALVDEINRSPLQQLFARSVGKTVTLDQIRGAFTAGFGAGAGDRLRVSCSRSGGGRLVTEITVGLEGDVMGKDGLAALVRQARPTNGGCDAGIVAAVRPGRR